MNKNEKFVITINREAGSGGRTVGSKVAEKLGVPFYDKALIQSLMEKYNLSVNEMNAISETSAFQCGFAFGVQIMTECIFKSQNSIGE